jgi:ketosteroid isomerase-like protein
MLRRSILALATGFLCAGVALLAGGGIGHAQQAEVDKIKATVDGFHAALSALDIRKMDEVWAHDSFVTVINPRDKAAKIGWDAVRKSFETEVFGFWSELKVTGREGIYIHVNGATAWANGIADVLGKPKSGAGNVNAPTLETGILEKRGDRWLIVSWSAWRVPQ